MSSHIVSRNRRARHDYAITETYEAGLVLLGSEVKSLRLGRVSIMGAYVARREEGFFLQGANIPPYHAAASGQNHEPDRLRKLLLKKREQKKLVGLLQQKGFSLIPLDIHFNPRGVAKTLLGLGKGRRQVDKREAIKSRQWERRKAKIEGGKLQGGETSSTRTRITRPKVRFAISKDSRRVA